MERGEKRGSPRQITLGLCDGRLEHKGIEVVRHDIENLIKLPQRFGETTKHDIGTRVLVEHGNVARGKPLGLLEVRPPPTPPASPPRDIRQLLRNPAAIGQKLTCLLKVMDRGVVI